VSGILSYTNDSFKLGIESVPCENSIENWVKKSGYKIYHTSPEKMSGKNYAEIIDESMMLGNEKMFFILGADADKIQKRALTTDDVSVLNIAVSPGWNSAGIESELEKTEKK
jgi:tRNA G18 (ribose-2'-O)-methylase SpoU